MTGVWAALVISGCALSVGGTWLRSKTGTPSLLADEERPGFFSRELAVPHPEFELWGRRLAYAGSMVAAFAALLGAATR